MVVCHCNVVDDRSIRELICTRATLEQITTTCGAGKDCGGCLDAIRSLLRQHDAETAVLIDSGAPAVK